MAKRVAQSPTGRNKRFHAEGAREVRSAFEVKVLPSKWGCGAAGSAPAWHAGGQGFKSPQLHFFGVTRLIWVVGVVNLQTNILWNF